MQFLAAVNPVRQRFWRVVGNHRNDCLYDQRSAIEFLGDEMHAAAVLAVAGFECTLVGCRPWCTAGSRECGDVEQASS